MISFSFSSGSAVLADFTVNSKGSGSVILVHSLSGQDQLSWRSDQVRAERLLETTSGFVSCLL